MKKIIFYFFIIHLLISCTKRLNEKEVHMGSDSLIYYNGNKYTGEVFDTYKNGRKKIEMIVNNGKLTGTKTEWYENGNLLSLENYIDNLKNGQFLKYSENGELIYEENYKKNVKHGYFENVQIDRKQIINYDNGKKNGYCKYVSTYGDAEGNYKDDYEDGIWKYYDYYKRLEKEISFKKGKKNGVSIIYNPDTGEIIEKTMFKNGIYVETNNQIVKTVKIGDQIWMSENLRTSFYQNGDEINFHNGTIDGRNNSPNPSYGYLNDDPLNYGNRFGKLYNWKAISDPRGICPKGFKVPSLGDWNKLFNYLGNDYIKKIKSKEGWEFYVWGVLENYGGNNESGLNIIPLELKTDKMAEFWTSSEDDDNYAYPITVYKNGEGMASGVVTSKEYFKSCRCIKIN
jgi:uncharacterized protein (TIGR02145 family)